MMLLAVELHLLISITANYVKLVLKCILVQPQGFFSDRAKRCFVVRVQSNNLPGFFAAASDVSSIWLNMRAPRSWQVQILKVLLKLLGNISGWNACSLARGCGFLVLPCPLFFALLTGLAIGKILLILKAILLGKLNLKRCPGTVNVVALMEDSQLCSCLSLWTCDIDGWVCVFWP